MDAHGPISYVFKVVGAVKIVKKLMLQKINIRRHHVLAGSGEITGMNQNWSSRVESEGVMKRLTRKSTITGKWMAAYGPQKITDHLAAYEDTGLTPEQIQAQQQEINRLKDENASIRNWNACEEEQYGQLLESDKRRIELEKQIKTLTALKHYKEAEQEGRLVVLPCNVGGTVYEPFAGKVYEKTVDRIIINRFTTPQIWIETKLPFATPRLERWDMAFGKTVFLTREEAEKALEGSE
jgi:hypothetical protein